MSNACPPLVADLARRGIRLELHGDRVRFHPRSAMTADLAGRLASQKAAVAAWLASPESSRPAPEPPRAARASWSDLMEALEALDRQGGRLSVVDMRIVVSGAPGFSDEHRRAIRQFQEELICSLAHKYERLWSDAPIEWPEPFRRDREQQHDDGRCRCGSRETKAVPIRGGEASRLDCATCGRFMRWGRWHGVDLDDPKAGR